MGDILDNCMAFDLDQVEQDLAAGHEATVQFDRPIGDVLLIVDPEEDDFDKWPLVPSAPYLERLDALCARWGDQLHVRFYAHYSEVFDGETLKRLPNIHSLSADCLSEAKNLAAIAELEHLSKLHLGVFELDDKAILEKMPVNRLRELTLSATNTKALDLAPLASATRLRKLYLDGHHKNIASLTALAGLREFTFNAKKNLDLGFVNGMCGLEALKFNLGGTETIEAIQLPNLKDMAFTMVRGLSELGDMQRFPKLRRLLMHDQQHIERVRFGAANQALEHLWFYNCQKLLEIEGLGECDKLKSLRWMFTNKDPATLSLPKSLTHLHMLSGKRKEEPQEIAAIEAMGYKAADHPGASFFYK